MILVFILPSGTTAVCLAFKLLTSALEFRVAFLQLFHCAFELLQSIRFRSACGSKRPDRGYQQ